jgi:hypothetical protein
MKERSLQKIKKDLAIISSNKLSPSQSILLFMGLTFEILMRKDLFAKNIDLKEFVEKFYIEKTEKKEPFKDYLYVSRTLLASRLNKLIIKELNYTKILDICRDIQSILPSEQDTRKNKPSKSQDEDVTEWMNFLERNGSKP